MYRMREAQRTKYRGVRPKESLTVRPFWELASVLSFLGGMTRSNVSVLCRSVLYVYI